MGEELGLRWQDVDLGNRRASLVQTVQKVAGRVVFGTVKTNASRRSVALDDATVEMLKEQRKAQAVDQLKVGPMWADLGLVFAGPTGEPLYPESVARSFRPRWGGSGFPR